MTLTRRTLLAAGAASASGLALRVPAASGKVEPGPLQLLRAYQQQVVASYDTALSAAAVDSGARRRLQPLRDEAAEAAESLRRAIRRAGGSPLPGPDAAGATGAGARELIRAVADAESTAVGGYYVGLQTFRDQALLAGLAAHMAQCGRHLVVLRDLAGDPLLDRAFETGGL